MNVLPLLQTHGAVVDELALAMSTEGVSSPDAPRWSDRQYRYAINQSLREWWDRVRVPHILDIEGLASSGEYAYDLPDYVRGPIVVQFLVWPGNPYAFIDQPVGYTPGTGETWMEAPGWSLEPGDSGGQVLRLAARPYSASGRVIWHQPNGPGPLLADGTAALLDGNISDTATSLTVTGAWDVHDAGYVKINNEWLRYAGVARGADTVLQNLGRGINGTTAASHTATDEIEWGIGVDTARLWQQLQRQARLHLHEYQLADGAEHERANHERMLQWYQGQTEAFWQQYTPSRRVRMRLTRGALA